MQLRKGRTEEESVWDEEVVEVEREIVEVILYMLYYRKAGNRKKSLTFFSDRKNRPRPNCYKDDSSSWPEGAEAVGFAHRIGA